MRPAETREAISRGKLASPASVLTRQANECAVGELVKLGRAELIQAGRVHSKVVHRILHRRLQELDSRTGTGYLLAIFLANTPAAFGEYARRRPDWLAATIAAAENETGGNAV